MAITLTEARARRKRPTSGGYESAIGSAIRALWTGAIDAGQFSDLLLAAIRRYLTAAWEAGMADVGVEPEEITEDERAELERLIMTEFGYVARLTGDIEARNKDAGGELAPLVARAGMWATRYTEARNMARTLAGAEQRLEWVWTPRKEHCPDCRRLNGIVKRASTWLLARARGLYPQSRALDCHGYHCGCELKPTNKPLTPGPLPKIKREI